MSSKTAEIIRIRIEEGAAGMLYATSPDLTGLFVAAPDRETLAEEIPAVIKAMFKVRNMEVEVWPARRHASEGPTVEPWPWVAVPAHLAANAV